jgi:hypothetical protein
MPKEILALLAGFETIGEGGKGKKRKRERGGNQICKRIKLLPHEGTLLPPPCHLAIHEVEEESEWQ